MCGALIDGKIFLWDRDNDRIQFITGLPRIFNEADKGNFVHSVIVLTVAA